MSNDKYKNEYIHLGIADGGCYADCESNFSHDTAAHITIYDRRLTPYLGDLKQGGIVIDKRPCIRRNDFVKNVVRGPMLNVMLPHDTINSVMAKRNLACTIEQARTAGGYDYISLNLYVQYWAELGARIGVRVGDKVYWNDGPLFGFGVPQDIPSVENRWQWDKPIE